jgi:hypothetical protein
MIILIRPDHRSLVNLPLRHIPQHQVSAQNPDSEQTLKHRAYTILHGARVTEIHQQHRVAGFAAALGLDMRGHA